MGRYSAGFSKAAVATSWLVELRTPSTKDARVFEIGLSLTTAATTELGIVRALTTGTTSASPTTPTAEDTSLGTAACFLDTAYTTAPTIAGTPVYLRRMVFPGTIGAGVIWTFPLGLVIPSSAGLLVWNIGAGTPTVSGYFLYDE